ncbi:hypothetical protein DICSQDRAFT_145142 [Dichomitus squalens LYAD-421 SS1]|uniref:uncharacterized protein n=1 Tax=Dichomitus squalens (strain LYAD-421) TaxID=732165 RepID=UPI0004415831|nr:uncharacterized protein DICSQDRAFT_145142 [Dichomitus squalens LYAD-421 SS1]EJF63644.1 hypothetical protein DICSQDRAFT_145142 [Dichomitus squalens LYAD-421 SS1]
MSDGICFKYIQATRDDCTHHVWTTQDTQRSCYMEELRMITVFEHPVFFSAI